MFSIDVTIGWCKIVCCKICAEINGLTWTRMVSVKLNTFLGIKQIVCVN